MNSFTFQISKWMVYLEIDCQIGLLSDRHRQDDSKILSSLSLSTIYLYITYNESATVCSSSIIDYKYIKKTKRLSVQRTNNIYTIFVSSMWSSFPKHTWNCFFTLSVTHSSVFNVMLTGFFLNFFIFVFFFFGLGVVLNLTLLSFAFMIKW